MLCLLAAAPATPIAVGGVVGTIFDEIEFRADIAELLPAIPMRADNLLDECWGVFAVEYRIFGGGFEGVRGTHDGGSIDCWVIF